MKKLYEFQEIGVKFLMNRPTAFLFDDMGLGKTVQVIEAIKGKKFHSGIVVCPLSVRRQWVRSIYNQYPGVMVNEIKSKNDTVIKNAINVIHYDIVWRTPMTEKLKSYLWQFIVFDEAHFLKSWESKRTFALLGKKGLYHNCEYRWCLTGTPVLNRPIELYPILRALSPQALGVFADYYLYAKEFCGAYTDSFGRLNVSGARNLAKLSIMIKTLFIRRTKQEVLSELPDIIYEKVYVDPTSKLMELDGAIKAQIRDVLSLQRMVGVIKAKTTVAHIEQILQTKDKVVVFTVHKDVVDIIKEHFPSAVKYTGDETSEQKQQAIHTFVNDDKCKVFIGNIKASGFGIDGLQHVCDHIIFAEISYVPGEMFQAIDRLFRIGQTKAVLVQFIVSENSMEENIINTLTAKSRNIKNILQDSRKEDFIDVECDACHNRVRINDAVRVNENTMCKKCKKEMECLL